MPNHEPRLIALIDESENGGYYRLGALVVRSDRADKLRLGLKAVIAKVAYEHGIAEDAELHGHELFHARGDWQPLREMVRLRISIYRQALEVIAEHCEGFLIKGVHVERFERRYRGRGYSTHENALTYLMEELDGYAAYEDMRMDLQADNSRFAAATKKHLENFKENGTWGYRSRLIKNIDDLTYHDSRATHVIQASDLVCYLHGRIASKHDKDMKAIKANEGLWALVQPLVRYNHDWVP